MRKAKITGCVAETVGTDMTLAAIGVGFKVGRYERYVHVVFPIETAKENIDRNINQTGSLFDNGQLYCPQKYMPKYHKPSNK